MNKRRESHSRPVYSTEFGKLCPQCHRPIASCVCHQQKSKTANSVNNIRLLRESKGRGGKVVTVVTGVPLAGSELKVLANTLKKKCGVGGSIKGENIEIQGDQRQKLQNELEKLGYTVKQAGG